MENSLKRNFIKIIEKYYPKMTYYQLIQLYFKIKDLNNPYFFYKKYNSNNVYQRLYWNKKNIKHSCCSNHINKFNLKFKMKKKLNDTKYEKNIYTKACDFYYQINSLVVFYSKIYYINNKKKYSKKELTNWKFIENNFRINKKGLFINDLKKGKSV